MKSVGFEMFHGEVAGSPTTGYLSRLQGHVCCARQMSQRPDTHASVIGSCANSRDHFSTTDWELLGEMSAGEMGINLPLTELPPDSGKPIKYHAIPGSKREISFRKPKPKLQLRAPPTLPDTVRIPASISALDTGECSSPARTPPPESGTTCLPESRMPPAHRCRRACT